MAKESQSAKSKSFKKQLLIANKSATNCYDLQKAAQGWNVINRETLEEGGHCHLCHTPLVNVVTIKKGSTTEFIGEDCWVKLQHLAQTGVLIDVNEVKEKKKKATKDYTDIFGPETNKPGNPSRPTEIAQTVTSWLMSQYIAGVKIPKRILNTLRHVEAFRYADSTEGARDMLEFYKNTRTFFVPDMMTQKQRFDLLIILSVNNLQKIEDYKAARKTYYYNNPAFKGMRYKTRDQKANDDTEIFISSLLADSLESEIYPERVTQNGWVELWQTMKNRINTTNNAANVRKQLQELVINMMLSSNSKGVLRNSNITQYKNSLFPVSFLIAKLDASWKITPNPRAWKCSLSLFPKMITLDLLSRMVTTYHKIVAKLKKAKTERKSLAGLGDRMFGSSDPEIFIDDNVRKYYSNNSLFPLSFLFSRYLKNRLFKEVSGEYPGLITIQDCLHICKSIEVRQNKINKAKMARKKLQNFSRKLFEKPYETALTCDFDLSEYSSKKFNRSFLCSSLIEILLSTYYYDLSFSMSREVIGHHNHSSIEAYFMTLPKQLSLKELSQFVDECRDMEFDSRYNVPVFFPKINNTRAEALLGFDDCIKLSFKKGVNRQTDESQWEKQIGKKKYIIDRDFSMEIDEKKLYYCHIVKNLVDLPHFQLFTVFPFCAIDIKKKNQPKPMKKKVRKPSYKAKIVGNINAPSQQSLEALAAKFS